MAFDIATVADETKTVIELYDPADPSSTITFTYRPNFETAASRRAIRDTAVNTPGDIGVEMLVASLDSWDVVLHGVPVPITAEGLAEVPDPIVAWVIRTMRKDAGVDRGEATAS